ncbi:L-lactate permease [Roseomonas sp. CAU 1739]|uniref:L-lactate permease n=1 Tax=Roseomonas sp. CAU 1739 TaxID=3140364 RepID=UPI00325BAA90
MILLLQAAPLLLLLGLLVSGRAGPLVAVLVALAAALPAAFVSLPAGSGFAPFLAEEAARGVFLAVQPIGVVLGGLLFHAAVEGRGDATATQAATPRAIFTATLLMGVFMESVTGFAVGAVFALAALRGMGLRGPPAAALALLSLCLIPWGGLGPGTALGAALLGLPAQAIATLTALPNAVWVLLLGPVCWRLTAAAGLVVTARERGIQMALLATMAAILVAGHWVLPFEVLGILGAGVPLLVALWLADPPRDALAWQRAVRALWPYALLTVALLGARAVPHPPAFHPYEGLPAFPVTHVAVVLLVVAGGILASRRNAGRRARDALKRAMRPAAAMLLYVLFARWMAGSGATGALASAAAGALGGLAPFAVPVLGLAAGVVTGSNVGSNAAMMPVQQALGLAAGLPPLLAPAVHNFAGAAGAGMSFAGTALVCGLLADGTRPAQIWRLLLPSMVAVIVLGWATVGLLR